MATVGSRRFGNLACVVRALLHSAMNQQVRAASGRFRIFTVIDVTATDEMADDSRARSNVVRLAAAQALSGANSAVICRHWLDRRRDAGAGYFAGDGAAFDVRGRLATGNLADRRSRRLWRRVAFMIGTGCGVLTGLIAALAILRGSFGLFCCAHSSADSTARVAILSFCRRRWRPAPPIAQGVSWVMRAACSPACSARNWCSGPWTSGRPTVCR